MGLAWRLPSTRSVSPPTTVRVQSVGEGEPALSIHGGPNAGSTWAPGLVHVAGLLLQDAGHLPWLDDPQTAAAATMSFLGVEVGSR